MFGIGALQPMHLILIVGILFMLTATIGFWIGVIKGLAWLARKSAERHNAQAEELRNR